MGWLRKLFAPRGHDSIADLRPGLGKLVSRAEASGEQCWFVDLYGCRVRGRPMGDWRVTVERIDPHD